MTNEQIDFLALYRELGIEADVSLDDLRLAYRRRVADLHPDRMGAAGEDDLKSLNLRYAAALEFHRHYGRLPGAQTTPPASRHDDAPAVGQQWAQEPAEEEPEAGRPSKVVVYGIVLIAILLVWWYSRTGAGSSAFQGYGVAGNERETTPRSAMALRRGMSRTEVLALLGTPASREHGDVLWNYESSWVRFECGGVVDWYSSPLQPLKASSSRPPVIEDARTVAIASPCPSTSVPTTSRWQAP